MKIGNKPWLNDIGGASLEAFLGSRGYRTSTIADTDGLIAEAARIFEIPKMPTCDAMARAVGALSKSERRRLTAKNIKRMKGGYIPQPGAYDVLISNYLFGMAADETNWDASKALAKAAEAIRDGMHKVKRKTP